MIGVDVLDAKTGKLVEHIDTTVYGSVNNIAIKHSVAAFAVEANNWSNPGVVLFNDTKSALPALVSMLLKLVCCPIS